MIAFLLVGLVVFTLKIKIDESIALYLIPAIAFYGLLPDFDIDSSKINNLIEKFLLGASIIALILLKYANIEQAFWIVFISVIVLFASKHMHHRGEFHTIRAGLILSFPLYLIEPRLFLMGFIAFLSHLIADNEVKI